jgi:REP element-mobilizing transposase RayT
MSHVFPSPSPLSHEQNLLDQARQAFKNKEYAKVEKILDSLCQQEKDNIEALRLAYENAKCLGRYRKAHKILKKMHPLIQASHGIWLKKEDLTCRRKIRHSNADTFLFFGVCFSAFYVTARYGMHYRNELFLLVGTASFIMGFSLRKFYLWDREN